MRNFVYGFFACAGLMILMGTTQVYNNFTDPKNVAVEFANVYSYIEKPYFAVYSTTPTPSALKQGQLIFVNSGGAVNLFTNVNGSTFCVVLTKR